MPVRIKTDNAPKAIGPYSQAIKTESLLFVSGQIPLCPDTGEVIGKDIESQTKRVLDNMAAILDEAQLSWEHIVKMEVFIKDMGHFKKMNEIYTSRFHGAQLPARFVVEVSRLPKDVLIEMACVAVLDLG